MLRKVYLLWRSGVGSVSDVVVRRPTKEDAGKPHSDAAMLRCEEVSH